jgi:hypothetical protein
MMSGSGSGQETIIPRMTWTTMRILRTMTTEEGESKGYICITTQGIGF